MRAALIALALAVLAAAPAAAQDPRLEAAREEAGSLPTPIAQLETPVGRLGLERAEMLAGRHDQPIRFALEVERAIDRGTLSVAIPRRWREVPSGGLRPTTPPRGRRVDRASRDAVEIVLDGAAAGERVTAELRDHGIPAGTYELPVSLDGRRIGRLEVVLYAPTREADEKPWAGVRALNFSDSPFDQSEAFVSVVPGNSQRLIAGSNGGMRGFSAWISDDGGDTWVERLVPGASPRISGAASLDPCCDPMSAADADGNLWYGGLDVKPDSHIVVARVPAGTNDFVRTVALPSRSPTANQDKPMMTLDDTPSSPTFGRLYVVWNEPAGGGHRIVTSFCDTRPDVTACDTAANWSPVTSITPSPGSVVYADVAVGPDGKVFVTWWNFSAANRIEGSVCASSCGTASSWSPPAGIALLDATGAKALPFECPILAQPGGRAAPGTNVEVSPTDGRVYVAWSDLRPGSGSTRCAEDVHPAGSHQRFDPFVKSAAGALPSTATPATRLVAEAEDADDWFPWLSVDPSSGIAYAAFYSTRDDATRRTAHFYARSVAAGGTLGPLVRVSDAPSDHSSATCCEFGNDYGDYAGLDVTGGLAFAAWSDKSSPSGEAVAEQLVIPPPNDATVLRPGVAEVGDAAGGDGDGVPEPGETLDVGIPVTNAGTATAAATTGTLSSPSPQVALPGATAEYGDVAAGATADGAPYRISLAGEMACGATVPLRLRVAHAAGFAVERYAVQSGAGVVGVASADVPKAISDVRTSAVTSRIVMPDAGRVGDVDVAVSISHPWVGDLTVILQHPDGTQAVLTQRTGDPANSGDDLAGTIFDDEAAVALFAATAPFTGRLRPDDPLAVFDGKPWAGTWRLTVFDDEPADGGALTGWSLQRRTCGEPIPDAPQPPPSTGDDGGAGAEAPQPLAPADAPPAVTPPPPLVVPQPFVALTRPGARVRVRAGRFRVGLRGCAGCRGRLSLTARVRRRTVRVARAAFTIGPRGTVSVNVRLGKTGRALLRRLKRVPLTAAMSASTPDGRAARATGRLTIRR